MGGSYNHPGVYVEEDHSLSLSVPAGETAVPVFVGRFWNKRELPTDALVLAQTKCTKVHNWNEFTALFDPGTAPASVTVNLTPQHGDAVQAGADDRRTRSKSKDGDKNLASDGGTVKTDLVKSSPESKGGQSKEETYTVSVINDAHRGGLSVRAYFENGGGPCYVLALRSSEDSEINQIENLIHAHQEISLLCYCEHNNSENDKINEKFNTLINNGSHGNPGYFVLTDAFHSSDAYVPDVTTHFSQNKAQVAAYYPALQMSYRIAWPADEKIALNGAPEGINNLAELKGNNTDNRYDKLLQAIVEALNAESIVYLRASVAMAGVYARTDRDRGVWKAPANTTLTAVEGLVWPKDSVFIPAPVSDAAQDKLNPKAVNAIRYFSTRGYTVWGARTLAGTDTGGELRWRYIPVRRLFNAIERDIKRAMHAVMFEPNNQPTWEKVRAAIESYLYALWRMGAMQGSKPQEAYFIQIGKDITMSDEEIRAGKLIVKIGVAAVRPAEFIILNFSQKLKDIAG